MTVILFSCKTGAGKNSLAQQVANLLADGSTVYAPTVDIPPPGSKYDPANDPNMKAFTANGGSTTSTPSASSKK